MSKFFFLLLHRRTNNNNNISYMFVSADIGNKRKLYISVSSIGRYYVDIEIYYIEIPFIYIFTTNMRP